MSNNIYDTSQPLTYSFDYQADESKRIHKNLSGKSSLNEADIWQIALWKYNRVINISPDVLNRLEEIKTDHSLTIESEYVQDTIKKLIKCKGISYPLASTILKFLRPDEFPIIDVRAYRAIYGKKIYYSSYSLKKYISYVNEVKKISKQKGLPLHEVDQQLYMYDKEENGKI